MQRIKESLRRKIAETALKEFDELGYEGASMRSIAQGAGTSLGNLYRYFHSKEDMYVQCLMPVLDECIRWTGQIFDVTPEALKLTASAMAQYVWAHGREFRIIVRGPAKHYAAFLDCFTKCVAEKLKLYSAEQKPRNPGFYDAVARAFISSLREILENGDNQENTEAYILELMRFMFADFDSRVKQLW